MRALVIIVAALAGLKVWAHDRLYRSAMQDALVEAYRERATVTCLKAYAKSHASLAADWPQAAVADVPIGNAETDVAFWDYQNPLWDVRFRHPHLVLAAPGQKTSCAFDVAAGLAAIEAN